MQPHFAVIIPCHEDGPLALKAVASTQEREPVELAVIDDGSVDPLTLEAMDELRSRGVTVVRRPRGGISAARTSGVEATAAPYVFPLDADDLLLRGSLERLANALDGAPDCGFAFGNFELFGQYRGTFQTPPRFDPWALTYANFISSGSMLRREAVAGVGCWDFPNGMEDWDLWLKIAETGWGGVRIPGIVYRRRASGNRMQAYGRRRHRRLCRQMRRRHQRLFFSRRALARESRASWAKRLLYPSLFELRNLGLVPLSLEAPVYRLMVSRGSRG